MKSEKLYPRYTLLMMTVDVLIPTYNPKESHLREALDGLIKQSHTDWHALIHDDCSSTDTAAIIAPYLADKRFTFVRSDARLGIGGNWNACRKQAKNEYIAYLFQDDVWSPTYLADAVRVLQNNLTVGFVSMEHTYNIEGMNEAAAQYDDVRKIRSEIENGKHERSVLLKKWIQMGLSPNIIGEPSFVVLRRSAMENAGPFLTDMPQFLDVEYWTRILLSSDWYMQKGDYGVFRVHAAGASAQNHDAGHGLFDRLRCFGLLISKLTGEEKKAAQKAQSKALQGMIGKFFTRLRSGKKIKAQGSGELRKFCMRHPFVVLKAFISYLLIAPPSSILPPKGEGSSVSMTAKIPPPHRGRG